MFSKEYFNYLIKSKKYLLLLILMMTLLSIFGVRPIRYGHAFVGYLCMMIAYAFPCNVFYYVHDKRAIDTYFSAPVSRKAMLITGVLFCVATAYIPCLLSMIVYAIAESVGFAFFLAYAVIMLLVAFALVIFNLVLYLSANNVFDGVVMIGAYTVIPLFVYFAAINFVDSFVAGGYFDYSIFAYLSPVWISGECFFSSGDFFNVGIGAGQIIALIVYIVVFSILLYLSYVNRDVERAGTPSDKIYSYPFVINAYMVLLIFVIATSYNFQNNSFSLFIENVFLAYLLLLVAYIGAHFVYKRKFYFSYKLLLSFVLAMALTLGFIQIARNTRGFHLAYNYKSDRSYNYNLSCNQYNVPVELIELEEYDEGAYVYYCINTTYDANNSDYKTISEKSMKIINKYRDMAIEDFYSGEDIYYDSNTYIGIDAGNHYYHYNTSTAMSLDDVRELAKDPNLHVSVILGYQEYTLLPDGTFYKIQY